MTTKLQKWGNSLGIRIPKQLCESAGLFESGEVDLVLCESGVVICPKKISKFKYNLDDLLAQCTPENKHDLVDFGPDVGKEIC